MTTDRRRLLVAVDGSPASNAAVEVALEIAAAMEAGVLFVHASSPLAEQLFADYPDDVPPAGEISARDPVLAAAGGRAAGRGVEAELEIVADEGGSVRLATEIAGLAAGRSAFMIVTGSRGRGTVAGSVLGSVSHNLIKHATVPVLVVHDPERDGSV